MAPRRGAAGEPAKGAGALEEGPPALRRSARSQPPSPAQMPPPPLPTAPVPASTALAAAAPPPSSAVQPQPQVAAALARTSSLKVLVVPVPPCTSRVLAPVHRVAIRCAKYLYSGCQHRSPQRKQAARKTTECGASHLFLHAVN